MPLKGATGTYVLSALETLQQHVGKAIAVFHTGNWLPTCVQPARSQTSRVPLAPIRRLLDMEDTTKIERPTPTPHLKRLEAESIFA